MPVPSSVRQQVGSFLDADDEVHYVFAAEVVRSWVPSMVFVVSRNRITIVRSTFFSSKRLKSVQATFERGTRIGPVDTEETPYFRLGGVEYEIDDEDVAAVEAADAELAQTVEPDDSLPEL